MGRPPCCDKIGVKKGPWTPEEDIILVSYIQEHGSGNWRSVPTNTGLLRCSKSCRLRWTNYLRPGIKRGDFTDQEEKMIFHLQALLGNRWAAIASYLPERTDNDIKNYWNTHLKKKLRKLQDGHNPDGISSSSKTSTSQPKGQWERRLQTDIHLAKQALCEALSLDKTNPLLPHSKPSDVAPCSLLSSNPTTTITPPHQPQASTATYASSAENIARLLQNWMKNSSKPVQSQSDTPQSSCNNTDVAGNSYSSTEGGAHCVMTPEGFDHSILSFNSSNSDTSQSKDENNITINSNLTSETSFDLFQEENKRSNLSLLEKWLFEEGASQGQEYLINNMSLDDVGLF